eukprot:13834046-Ditylum_brightwellii.AAC.1
MFCQGSGTGLVPLEESVKCFIIQTGKVHLSTNQMQAVGPSTQYKVCNSLYGEEEGLHTLSGA